MKTGHGVNLFAHFTNEIEFSENVFNMKEMIMFVIMIMIMFMNMCMVICCMIINDTTTKVICITRFVAWTILVRET